jgi:hypothetical protein
MKEFRQRLDLSCERPCVPILDLIGDAGLFVQAINVSPSHAQIVALGASNE